MKQFLEKSPDEFIKGLLKSITLGKKREMITVYLSSLITCFFCYFYFSINWYSGPDSIIEGTYLYTGADTAAASGRWMIRLINLFFGKNLIIPFITVLFYCLFIAEATFLVAVMFNIKKTGYLVLLSALMISVSPVIRQFAYLYTCLCYALAMLFSVLGIKLIREKKLGGFILGALSFLGMFGCFQSYMGAVAGLTVLLFVYDILEGEKLSRAFEKLGKVAAAGIIAAVTNLFVIKIVTKLLNIEVLGRVENFSVKAITENIGFSLKYAFVWFVTFFTGDPVMKRNYVYTIMLAALVLVFILKAFLEAKKMPVINTIVAVVFFMLVPLCMNIILILIPTNGINLYMKHHYILAFGFMFALLERFEESVAKNLCLWVIYLSFVFVVSTNVISANASAICYKLSYEATYTQAELMLAEVRNLEEYDPDMPVALGGIIRYDFTYEFFQPIYDYAFTGAGPVFWNGTYGSTASRELYFINYLGIDLKPITDDQFRTIIRSDEFKEMPVWPATGSVKVIDGCAVIKTEQNPEE